MEAKQILKSDILDILFEGRNKLYGAYDLRKTYNQRITAALSISLLLILAFFISTVIAKKIHKVPIAVTINAGEATVHEVPRDIPKPPTVPKPKLASHIATAKVTIPVITIDKLVTEVPPDQIQIENSVIDIKSTVGISATEITNPPSDVIGTSVVSSPVNKKSKEDSVSKIVQIEATFPGGLPAWQRYIQKVISAHLDEFTDSDFGTCVVNFIVDKNGKVSNVQATTLKGTKLAEIAVITIKNGPNWIPAIQNGNYVNAYRTQPVTLINPNE